MTPKLKDLIPNQAKLARDLGVSSQTIFTWVKLNAIPPSRVAKAAIALKLSPGDLFPFMKKARLVPKMNQKTPEDLDALLAAYQGRPYTTDLSETAVKLILGHWGHRLPLMYETLHALRKGSITVGQAADTLQVTKATINNLRSRYGMAPGPLKAAPKKPGRYKRVTTLAKSVVGDVVSGRKSAVAAAKLAKVSLRTLHRHIEGVLRPQTLNELAHWSLSFRAALAQEINSGGPRHTVEWRKWTEKRALILPKKPSWPKLPTNWKEAKVRRIAIAVLRSEVSIEEVAAARGGDPKIVEELVKKEVESLTFSPFSLGFHHQDALAEVLLALDSLYRRGIKHV